MRCRLLFLFVAWCIAAVAWADPLDDASAGVRGENDTIDREALVQAIAEARHRVPEFAALRTEAMRRGLRVWIFGGTAAGFAAYVADDILRARGAVAYAPAHFGYLLPQIYRPRQDLDLVLDSPDKDPAHMNLWDFEYAVAAFLPATGTFRSGAEMRWLRHPYGTKEALLGNPEVLRQSVDSASIGFIELTDPPAGEPVVRDLHRWLDDKGSFVETFARGIVHFHRSDEHRTTARFLRGDNPLLISILRWLGKGTQYRLRFDSEELKSMHADVGRAQMEGLTSYARAQLVKVGVKLYLHAADVGRAYQLAERMGVKEKLVQLDGATQTGSAGWWASRKPLPAFPLGQGDGRTAAEMTPPLDIVTHDATNLDSFEALLRAPVGVVNALASRQVVGERAVYGDGFYVQRGNEGAWRSGFNVRFRLRSNAVLGKDFIHAIGDWWVVLNRNALEVISEPLERDPLRFLEMLPLLKSADGGTVDRLCRGYRGLVTTLDASAREAILQRLTEMLLAKSPVLFLDKMLEVLAQAPFTVAELLPALDATKGDARLYPLVLSRAMRAVTAEEAAAIRELCGQRGFGAAILRALPAEKIGQGARQVILELISEGKFPRWQQHRTLRRMLFLPAVGSTSEALPRRNPTWGMRKLWTGFLTGAMALTAGVSGSVYGIQQWRYHLGLPEIDDNRLCTEQALRLKAREAKVPYENYVKFAAPLGVGTFPSLPREMAMEAFLPLLREGSQEDIDRRAQQFRQLVADYAQRNPEPSKESRDQYSTSNEKFYREWKEHICRISVVVTAPEYVVEPIGALKFLEAVDKIPNGYDYTFRMDYYASATTRKSVQRLVAYRNLHPDKALPFVIALINTRKKFDLYDGIPKLWDVAEKRADPIAFLEAMQLLGEIHRGDYKNYREWQVPDGAMVVTMADLAVKYGAPKVKDIVEEADTAGLSGADMTNFVTTTCERGDWKEYLDSRRNLRGHLNDLGGSGSDGRKSYRERRMRELEAQHPCAALIAEYAQLAELSQVYPFDPEVKEAELEAFDRRYRGMAGLSVYTERFKEAVKYASTTSMTKAQMREFCDLVAQRADYLEAIGGHLAASQVTRTQLQGRSALEPLVLESARATAAAKNPVGFAGAYRNALQAEVVRGVAVGGEAAAVKRAMAEAAKIVP